MDLNSKLKMDEKRNTSKENSESSLSESWNIVDGTDVNNVSEGSDGESIEVIDEESNKPDVENANKQEGKNESEVGSSLTNDNESLVTTSELECNVSTIKENVTVPSSVETEGPGNMNTFNILGLVALVCAIIFAGATSWIVLLRVEELALETFHYFIPENFQQSSSSNNKEFHILKNQIQMYEEETKNLRFLVTDLSEAVENLKSELASSLKFAEKTGRPIASKKEHNQVTNKEDILFQELMNIHFGKYPNASLFHNEVNSSYKEVAKFVQEMISNLTVGEEQKTYMEVVELFYRIPKHLKILNKYNSTNKNTDIFIGSWKGRINYVNEKIVEDVKNMQLKMVRHVVKLIKCAQKKFYSKLCNINGMKKQECYDLFVKPYEHSEDPDVGESFKETTDNEVYKQKSDSLPAKKDFSDMELEKHLDNTEKLRRNGDNKNGDELLKKPKLKYLNENNQPDFKALKKMIDAQKIKHKERNGVSETHNEKGMNNGGINTDPPNNDPINSFSSFSKGQGDETDSEPKSFFKKRKQGEGPCQKEEGGLQEKKEKLSGSSESDVNEGCWFLKIGRQRSILRKSEARSNWMFERARYRSSRNT